MTNYLEVKTNAPRRRGNKKDGGTGQPRSRDWAAFREQTLTDLGFTEETTSSYSYTWPGVPNCPVWQIAPGRIGLVARWQDEEVLFPYGLRPAEIKRRLDDEILANFRREAETAEVETDWAEWGAEGLADDFMAEVV